MFENTSSPYMKSQSDMSYSVLSTLLSDANIEKKDISMVQLRPSDAWKTEY